MFALRGVTVALSIFAIVYCAFSLLISSSWRKIYRWVQDRPQDRLADLLFAVRMSPLGSAALITVAFTVPSFLLLEPRSIVEPMSWGLIAAAVCGVGLGLFGLAHGASGLMQAAHAISALTAEARSLRTESSHPVLRTSHAVPPMAAVGIAAPRVLISGAAEFVLSENELRAALNHEVAHIYRRDNLKKLLFRFVAFPGMRGLETAWLESTEMAADDAAVSSASEALDLAAALVKLSRVPASGIELGLTAAGPSSIVNVRIERLIAWRDRAEIPQLSLLWPITATGAVAFVVTYGQLLVRIHAATEWLVR